MIELDTETSRFEFIGGWLSLDFANTISNYVGVREGERLHEYGDLVRWGLEAGVLTGEQARGLAKRGRLAPEQAEQVVERALALREAVHWIFSAVADERRPDGEHLDALNAELALALPHARVMHTEEGFEWGWTEEEAFDRMLWPVARSAAELLTSGVELERVRECAGDTCGWLFLDKSRNHSRHWCDMKDCGNRAKVRRFYQRKKSEK